MRKIKLLFTVLSVLFMLSSCGDGSDSSRVEERVVSVIEGYAIDDRIVNGIVTAYDNSYVRLSSTRSGNEGYYRMEVQDYIGLVILEVTCDADSTMLAADGSITACPLNTRLRSFGITAGRATPVIAHITPLTELVFIRAEQLSGGLPISQVAFEQARAEIGEYYGVDPINDDPTTGLYYAIIQAFNDVADANDQDVQDVIDDIAEDISDGSSGDSDTTEDLVDAMEDNNVSNNLTDYDGYYTPSTDDSADIDGDGTISDLEAIAIAKGMFKNLRSSTLALVDYEGGNENGSVDIELQNFGEVATEFGLKMESASVYKSDIITLILSAIQETKTSNNGTIGNANEFNVTVTKESDTLWSYQFNGYASYLGTVTVPTDDPATYQTTNNFSQLAFRFEGTLPEYRPNGSNSDFGLQTLTGDLDISNSNGEITIVLSNGTLKSQSEDETLNVSEMVVHSNRLIDGEYTKLEKIAFDGNIQNYVVDAQIEVDSYTQNSSISNNSGYLPNQVTFTGSLENTQSGTKIEDTKIIASWQNVVLMNQNMVDHYAYQELIDLDLVLASGKHLLFSSDAPSDEPLLEIQMQGKIKIASQSQKIVNVQFKNFANGSRTFYLSYIGDGMVINLTANFTSADSQNGTIYVSNHLGVKGSFVVENGALVDGDDSGSGSIITKDSLPIGLVEDRSGIPFVVYTDGSVESLY